MTLSQTIENEIARRIRKKESLPCELKLLPLALYFGCSTRPVREAMANLRTKGLLTPAKINKLRIESKPEAKSFEVSDTKSPPYRPSAFLAHASDTLSRLTRQLIEQSLHAGDEVIFVRESAVAKQLGTSTTVAREHFSRLVGYGLLEHVPRRGWRLRPVRQKDLDDFIHARLSLETLALSIAWEKIDHAVIQKFLEGNTLSAKTTGKRTATHTRTDNGFHRYIIDVADNFYIRDFFDRQGRFFQLLFEWEDQDPATTAQTIRQHRRILKAILQDDQAKAQAALKVHILDNHPVLTTVLKG